MHNESANVNAVNPPAPSLTRKKTHGSTCSNLSAHSTSSQSVKIKPSDTTIVDDIHYTASDDNKKMINIATINSRKDVQKLDKNEQQKYNECKQSDILGLLSLNTFSQQQSDEKICLKQNGFIRKNKICDTLQGELFEGETINNSLSETVVIKKTDKNLYNKRISVQQEMNIIVEEDIIKEAIILHHLTVDNKPISDYIVRFIKFFENEDAFYLVMEKAGNINLADFNKKAHQYIAEKKLKIKQWKKIVKYLFWQLAVIIYWLHHDMNCCHLNLNLSNIVLLNGNFVEKPDGTVMIDPNIKIKLVDFGLSEIFKSSGSLQKYVQIMENKEEDKKDDDDDDDDDDDECKNNPFKCNKFGIIDKHYLSAPNVFNEEIYDAQKSDIWSLGIILYELATGLEPYKFPDIKDKDFHKVKHQKLVELLEIQDKTKYVNQRMVQLMCNMLNVRENERFNCMDVVSDEWLNLYYNKYKTQLIKKSQLQKSRNKKLMSKMEIFPFYQCSD